ncbi:MAG: anaerobic sulfatase maturase [Candidatus Margulisiibacteriota bacterium]
MADPSSAGLHVIAKPIGPVCNLNCTYCFYLEKLNLYPQKENFRMSDEVLETFIRQYIEAQPNPEVEFVWQGGEPALLGIDFFNKAVKLQKKYEQDKKIKNCLQTNGVLLNDEWCDFLKKNDFLVGISLDGPEEVHDLYRRDRAGQGTFDSVIRGLRLLKKHGVEFNVLACVARETAKRPREVYQFLKAAGVEYIQFAPIVERDESGKILPWTVEAESYGDFLNKIFDEWAANDVGKIFVMNFEWALNAWVFQKSPVCLFSETCGRSLVIEHNGDVYSCDHFVYPQYLLGNVLKDKLKDLVELPQQKAFGAAKKELLPQCRRCDFLFACRGECPKRKQYLCAGYKKYFLHITQYMNGMRTLLEHNRPVSDIMKSFKGPLFIVPDKGEKQ